SYNGINGWHLSNGDRKTVTITCDDIFGGSLEGDIIITYCDDSQADSENPENNNIDYKGIIIEQINNFSLEEPYCYNYETKDSCGAQYSLNNNYVSVAIQIFDNGLLLNKSLSNLLNLYQRENLQNIGEYTSGENTVFLFKDTPNFYVWTSKNKLITVSGDNYENSLKVLEEYLKKYPSNDQNSDNAEENCNTFSHVLRGRLVYQNPEEDVMQTTSVQKITGNVVVGKSITGKAIDEMVVEETPKLISPYYAREYKFNVKATLSTNPKIYDTNYAVLRIEPEVFIEPPEFPTEEVTIDLYKGWNLISLPGKLVQFSDDGCTLNRKLLGFVYLKEEQRYVTLQQAETILGTNFAEYLAKNAFWIYSYEDCNLRARVDIKVSYSGINLYEGWNLIPITDDIVGGYLNDVMSECDIEKVHKWNAQNQVWEKITTDYTFSNTETYYGFITKVTNNCVLGGVNILEMSEIEEEE
ncbi:MAG: hypothetical protein PHV16_02435, partial [Candidatus Nanoarchaeia archaeon]|nr:hypothetical protein [Candidatus Nanoarchaeia archaeon]